MLDKSKFDDGFICNPSIRECECDKSCVVGEYLDYGNCKCRKILTDKVVEECSEDITGNEIIYNVTLNNRKNECYFWSIDIVILIIVFMITDRIYLFFLLVHGKKWCRYFFC